MKIAFILFDGITWLDLSGVYEPVSRLKYTGYLPDLSWDFCAFTPTAEDQGGLKVIPNKIKNDLSNYDAIIIPGGKGTRDLISDDEFMTWIKTAEKVSWKISVCTGSLILGAAGFLLGKKATTHFDAYDLLEPFCKEVVQYLIDNKWDGNVILEYLFEFHDQMQKDLELLKAMH